MGVPSTHELLQFKVMIHNQNQPSIPASVVMPAVHVDIPKKIKIYHNIPEAKIN